MSLPQTWDWTESLAADPPVTAAPAPSWAAQDVFRPAEPENSAAEADRFEELDDGESGEVELGEWRPAPMQDEAFPSGLALGPGAGATGQGEEHWDPNATGLPLYATGPDVRPLRLAANFIVDELVSSGGTPSDVARISPVLVRRLQQLRDFLGRPVLVSSGYRSWARNTALYRGRGATPTRSRHCSGQAADITVTGMPGLELAKAALDACGKNIALGIGETYVHLDVRGAWARWSYAKGDAAARDVAAIDAHRAGLGKTPAAPRPGPGAPASGSLPARIAQIAAQERTRWGNGTRRETDPGMTATLQEYYRVGIGETVSAGDLRSSTWQEAHPWSAVFISWVMRTAGAGAAFHYSPGHYVYVSAAKHNAEKGDTANPFWAYPIEKVVPEVGDLVCADRTSHGHCGGVTYATIDNGTAWSTHCDVVLAVDRAARKLTVAGGNVSDSVKDKTVAIDAQGFVVPAQAGQSCRYYAILKVRDVSAGPRQEAPVALHPDALARAVRLNTSYAPQLGWDRHLPTIATVIAAPEPSPAGTPFAHAVARWQRGRGLAPDGVIGPDSWTDLTRVIAHREGGIG